MTIRKVARVPFVYDYVDPYTEMAGQGTLNIYSFIERAMPRSDLTICVSISLADKARSFGARRIRIIPNGFEAELLRCEPVIKPWEKKVVLYLGQITKSHRWESLAEEYAKLLEDLMGVRDW